MNLPEIISISLYNCFVNDSRMIAVAPASVLERCGQSRGAVTYEAMKSLRVRLEPLRIDTVTLKGAGTFKCTLLSAPEVSTDELKASPSKLPVYAYFKVSKPLSLCINQSDKHPQSSTLEAICSSYSWSQTLELSSDLLERDIEDIGHAITAAEDHIFCRIMSSGELSFRSLIWSGSKFRSEDITS